MIKEPNLWSRIFSVGKELNLTEKNLYKMRERGKVPPKHHNAMLLKARKIGVRLSYQELNQ